jgi:hypothetical protein
VQVRRRRVALRRGPEVELHAIWRNHGNRDAGRAVTAAVRDWGGPLRR